MVGFVQTLNAGSDVQTDLLRFTFTEYHMGINARIVAYAPDQTTAEKACEAAFKRIAELEQVMSDYRPDSELMKMCAISASEPVQVSDDLFKVLTASMNISKRTNGAFDVTVGPLVQLWRKARRETKLPAATEIEAAKKLVGWQKITLDSKAKTVKLAREGMKLDLGGIAKGYACDEALKAMRRYGVTSALIEMGGDIVLGDGPPGAMGWRISVPNASSPGKPAELALKNCAISSSGDTEQFVVIDGVRHSHVVNTKTGYGLSTRVQASVIAPNGFTADPISTALTLMEPEKHSVLLRHYPSVHTYRRIARD
jgi:thiamine biosynthesis lipoprotein